MQQRLAGSFRHWVATAPRNGRRCYASSDRNPAAWRRGAAAYALRRRAQKLQRSLGAEPENTQKFVELLRTFNQFDPQQTVRYFENQDPRNAFSKADSVREYVKALVFTNRLDFVDLDHALGKHWRKVRLGIDSEKEAGGSGDAQDQLQLKLSTGSPMQVQIADTHRKSFWRLIRTIIAMIIVVAAVTVCAEGLVSNVNKTFGVGSKKIVPVDDVNTTFHDVKGCDEVKNELQEIILYLKDPERFTRLGARLPKGVLMSGPPGTGKTLLARAIAGEAGTPFLHASGSEFEEMFVGVGARRIRDLFQEARKHAPCILFIDEIDAVGSKRSDREHASGRMTLNQLLVELDGFEQNNGIVVVCATNSPEILDRALTRPGRLDKMVSVPVPDLKGRREILQLYASKIVLGDDADLDVLARRTTGMTGADLFNLLNIATIRSSADNLEVVSMKYLEDAFDRVVIGLERPSPLSDEEKRLTAYHEGGHALISMFRPNADPVHKATIMPRGEALGVTSTIPDRERYSHRFNELKTRIEVMMGGKAAEELIFGPENVTAGCTSDLQAATNLARQMVTKFGMGDSSAPSLRYCDDDYEYLADETKHNIDEMTRSLLSNAYHQASEFLKEHEKELHRLAQALVEFETLSSDEIKLVLKGNSGTVSRQRRELAKAAENAQVPIETATT